MAKQRYINTKFWSDNYIVKLDPIEKLLFLYLMTNEKTNIAGLYELPAKIMSFETGIESTLLEAMLLRFERDDKIFFYNGWVFLKNFLKHQNVTSAQVQKGIENEMKTIPKEIFEHFDKKCNIKGIFNTLCIPSIYRSIYLYLYSNLDSNSDLDLSIYQTAKSDLVDSTSSYPEMIEELEEGQEGYAEQQKRKQQEEKEANRFRTPVAKINTGKEQKTEEEKEDSKNLHFEGVELCDFFEKVTKRKMPDQVTQTTFKGQIKDVDLNYEAAKRLVKKYTLENAKNYIKLFFELRENVPKEEKKYIPGAGNIYMFERSLAKIFKWIDNEGVDPHTGKRFKNAKPNTTFEEMAKGKVVRKDKW